MRLPAIYNLQSAICNLLGVYVGVSGLSIAWMPQAGGGTGERAGHAALASRLVVPYDRESAYHRIVNYSSTYSSASAVGVLLRSRSRVSQRPGEASPRPRPARTGRRRTEGEHDRHAAAPVL